LRVRVCCNANRQRQYDRQSTKHVSLPSNKISGLYTRYR
jgi:hypothetical protein